MARYINTLPDCLEGMACFAYESFIKSKNYDILAGLAGAQEGDTEGRRGYPVSP